MSKLPEKYKVLEAFSYNDQLAAANALSEKVNMHINNGWIPQGGIVIGFHENGRQSYWYAMQAMVMSGERKKPLKSPHELAADANFFGEGIA